MGGWCNAGWTGGRAEQFRNEDNPGMAFLPFVLQAVLGAGLFLLILWWIQHDASHVLLASC